MSNSAPRKQLPANPSIEHLQKQAKRLARKNPPLKLAQAQHQLAHEYGCKNWSELAGLVETMRRSSDEIEQLKVALLQEDGVTVTHLLDQRPGLLSPDLWPTAIYQAKSLSMTKLLLERGLHPDECSAPRKPLHLAVYQCLPDIVELLIAHGANVNLRNPLDETPLDLLDAYEPRPTGDPDAKRIRKALVAAGAREDFYSFIRAGEISRVREMLETEPGLAISNSGLGGPLFAAARCARPEIVSALLEFGADPNKTNDKGNTPLWFAAQSPAQPVSNRIAVMKVLLEAGADINRRCEDGSTALHYAAWRGPAEAVEFLLSSGARNWIGDQKGKLPVDYARESGSIDKQAIMELFSGPRIKNPVLKKAVDIITTGNLTGLKALLTQYPDIVHARAEEKGEYAGEYFFHPTLLHFVAENPTRTGRLPENICELTQAILDAGAEIDAVTTGPSPHTTLALVATSEPARKQGLQLPLIELLCQNGADPRRGYFGAVIHREKAAIDLLLKLTHYDHTLVTAAGIGEIEIIKKLLRENIDPKEMAEAANVSIMEGHQNCLEEILRAGVPKDSTIPHHPYSPTLLHQAASFGRGEIVKFLLGLGANPTLRDTQFRGTPADWAHQAGHGELEVLLRNAENESPPKRQFHK